MSTPNLTPEQIEFQQHARAWLEANPAPETEIELPLSQLGHQAFDELASLHQDVGRSVTPSSLEAQCEGPVGAFFEPLVCERGPGNVAAAPLEAASISGRDGHVCVEARAAVLGHARRCISVRAGRRGLPWLDPIAQPTPWLAPAWPDGDADSQRGRSQQRQDKRGE